jgi:glycosyltransferase involved in cell wall biosynthesis
LLYICIPVFNEAPTVGLVLWKLRKVLQENSRDFEVVIYDDGSTDGTRDTLSTYADVLPLTVIGSSKRGGYARALDALVRHVTTKTKYPRRDAMVVMQGDLTDQPDDIPELVKRFEGGADIIVAERAMEAPMPVAVRRLRRWSAWLSRPGAVQFRARTIIYRQAMVSIPGVSDPFGSLRLYRISVLRDLVKAHGKDTLVENDGWAANAELLLRAREHARRVETVTFAQRFDLRPRESRVRPWTDGRALFAFGRVARSLSEREVAERTPRRA